MSDPSSGKSSSDAFTEARKEKERLSRARYEADPKRCKFCRAKLSYEQRRNTFCSTSCSASFNNQGVTRHIKGSKFCDCGNPKKVANKYCSACSEKRVYNKVTTLANAKSDKTRKLVLLEQREHRCAVCGLAEWLQQPIPLELDHIDGDTDNNGAENLRLVCPNCHAQTGTHRRRNKNGKRQLMRRKRYADGQTW
jgi:hypothetical protein